MREIVFDTETTGLEPAEGHRVVEIGAVELHNHVPTGRTWHHYVNPRRDMPQEAFAIHGISAEFLADKPAFEAIADDFLAFVAGATLVAHNAGFDVKFLNAELGWAGRPLLSEAAIVDTLALARRKFPGAMVSLDALCRRFEIDNSRRTYHGALLDSEILAEVYLELIGGRQPGLVLGASRSAGEGSAVSADGEGWRPRPRPRPLPGRLTDAERAAHARMVEGLGEGALWRRYEG